MKTTLDIHDSLILRAKRLSKQTGRPLRALVEEGLRHVLENRASRQRYELADCSVGDPAVADPLEKLTWQDLRDEIYGSGGRS